MTEAASTLLPVPGTDEFRAAMGGFPTGVALLTQGSGTSTAAVTVNSLTSVSLEPMLLLVCVKRDGRMTRQLSAGGGFGLSVLAENQQWISTLFSRSPRPVGSAAMRELAAVAGITGNAVLPAAIASFECRTEAEYEGGDHRVFLGRVVALHRGEPGQRPLLFHQGRYAALDTREAPA